MIAASIVAACLCIRWPDARALENRYKAGTAPRPQPFRVADFVAEPLVVLPGGRALPYIMPVVLPSRFELVGRGPGERRAISPTSRSPATLWESINVRRNGSASTPSSFDDAESWHQVRLECRGPELSLWVDDRKIPAVVQPEATSESLTFEPGPERPTRFRNLVVEWQIVEAPRPQDPD